MIKLFSLLHCPQILDENVFADNDETLQLTTVPTNMRLGMDWLTVMNTLAYYIDHKHKIRGEVTDTDETLQLITLTTNMRLVVKRLTLMNTLAYYIDHK